MNNALRIKCALAAAGLLATQVFVDGNMPIAIRLQPKEVDWGDPPTYKRQNQTFDAPGRARRKKGKR